MNQSTVRNRVFLAGHAEAIKERWFSSANELLRPIKAALGQAYPIAFRDKNLPRYDAEISRAYENKRSLAESFRNQQRNIVNNQWLPRYEISLAKPGSHPSEAHKELEALLVDGCLDRFFENLGAFAPMILPKEQAQEVFATLPGILERESGRLRDYLAKYRVEYRPGVKPIAEELQ
jgi:hypothetical protein